MAYCSVCDGTGYLSASFVFGGASVCTCGAADLAELAEMVLHDASCDAVPCPFDQLLDQALRHRVL